MAAPRGVIQLLQQRPARSAPLTASCRNSGTSDCPVKRLGCEKWLTFTSPAAAAALRERVEAVGDHHRPTRQQSLQGRGPRGHQHRIGGDQRLLRVAVDERNSQSGATRARCAANMARTPLEASGQ